MTQKTSEEGRDQFCSSGPRVAGSTTGSGAGTESGLQVCGVSLPSLWAPKLDPAPSLLVPASLQVPPIQTEEK